MNQGYYSINAEIFTHPVSSLGKSVCRRYEIAESGIRPMKGMRLYVIGKSTGRQRETLRAFVLGGPGIGEDGVCAGDASSVTSESDGAAA